MTSLNTRPCYPRRYSVIVLQSPKAPSLATCNDEDVSKFPPHPHRHRRLPSPKTSQPPQWRRSYLAKLNTIQNIEQQSPQQKTKRKVRGTAGSGLGTQVRSRALSQRERRSPVCGLLLWGRQRVQGLEGFGFLGFWGTQESPSTKNGFRVFLGLGRLKRRTARNLPGPSRRCSFGFVWLRSGSRNWES